MEQKVPLQRQVQPPLTPPRIVGMDLAVRLEELARTAHREHVAVLNGWRDVLEHARAAGEALDEAKRRLGHRSKWGRWQRKVAEKNMV